MRGQIVNPYLLTLLKALIVLRIKGEYRVGDSLTKKDRQEIQNQFRQISASSLGHVFRKTELSRDKFDDNTLDNLVSIIKKDYNYNDWSDFVQKESGNLSEKYNRLPENFYGLKEEDQNIIYKAILKRIEQLKKQNGSRELQVNISLAQIYLNLGISEEVKCNLQKAKKHYYDCHRSEPNNPDHLIRIATLEHKMGNTNQAIELFNQVIEISKKSNIETYLYLALNNIGLCYVHLGDYDQALVVLNQAFGYAKNDCLLEEQGLAKILDNIGVVEFYRLNYKMAIGYFERTLRFSEFKMVRPQILAMRKMNLGLAYSKSGQYEKAEKYLQEAKEIDKKIYPPNHSILASSTYNLVAFFVERGTTSIAIGILEEYFNGIDFSLTINDKYIIRNLSFLVDLYMNILKWKKAKPVLDRLYLIVSKAPNTSNVNRKILEKKIDFIAEKMKD